MDVTQFMDEHAKESPWEDFYLCALTYPFVSFRWLLNVCNVSGDYDLDPVWKRIVSCTVLFNLHPYTQLSLFTSQQSSIHADRPCHRHRKKCYIDGWKGFPTHSVHRSVCQK